MAKLYSNENVPLPTVHHLRLLGHDVLTSFEAGNANRGIADPFVIQFAFEQRRVLLSNNRRDFVRLHRSGVPHRGLVLFTADGDFMALAERIAAALSDIQEGERAFVKVTKEGHRVVDG